MQRKANMKERRTVRVEKMIHELIAEENSSYIEERLK